MPIYTFNYTAPTSAGESRVFRHQILLNTRPPPGTRFYIRQVSATSSATFTNAFKYVNVYIPELMGVTEQVRFIQYTVDATGNPQLGTVTTPGIRFFLDNHSAVLPFTINQFPNLNLGRHQLSSHYLTLELTPFNVTGLGNIYSYSVVIEWDSE